MRRIIIISIILVIISVSVYVLFLFPKVETDTNGNHNVSDITMIITSPSFENNSYIPRKFTCDSSALLTTGGGINPELQIQNVPKEAKSLALIVHDPDAPRVGGFTHWLVWNIAPQTAVIKEESVPPGAVEGKNDSGKVGYMGPCPPSGVHHYHFKLYALDATFNLPQGAGRASLEAEINKRLISEAELIGLYKR